MLQSIGLERVRHDLVTEHPSARNSPLTRSRRRRQGTAMFVTSWTVASQAPLSMGFPRQEYWSGLAFPTPRDLPNPGGGGGAPRDSAGSGATEEGLIQSSVVENLHANAEDMGLIPG